MGFELAQVEFHSEKNNFILLHSGQNNGLLDLVPVTLTLLSENGSIYVSGFAEKNIHKTAKKIYVKVNGLFASKHNLKPGDQICWSFIDNLPKCNEIFVDPLTVDDWEIISSNASAIEEELLHQLRVAYKNLTFPLWINNSLCVFFRVDSVKPNANYVLLEDGTTVNVAPKLFSNSKFLANGVIKHTSSSDNSDINSIAHKPTDLPINSTNFIEHKTDKIPKILPSVSRLSPDMVSPKRTNFINSDSQTSKGKEIVGKKSSSPVFHSNSPLSSLWTRIKGAFSPSVEDKSKDFLQKSPKSSNKETETSVLSPIIEDFECNVFEPLLEDIVDYFEAVCYDGNFCGHALLEGPTLSGTTFTAELLRRRLLTDLKTYSKLLDCKPLCGKSVTHVQKALCQTFDDCIKRGPCLIVLDDLDQLCCSVNAMKQLTPGADIHVAQVTKALIQILDQIWIEKRKVLVLATCKSKQKLNDSLTTVRGKRYFTKFFSLPGLSQKNREELFSSVLTRNQILTLPKNVVSKLVKSTDGCVAGDIQRLCDRVLRVCFLRDNLTDISEDDVIRALDGFESINLHSAQVNKSVDGEQSWSDVGGLDEVKKNIIRVLQWPAKYSAIFSSLNVRLARGILLYGPSGTGKTLLASVIAKECSLNFIVIKGAELLSKYIGASEQAVRDTFSRARTAKPSLILFDEFEALAPRRGHDSTGVTDRVVNQLLTELDGVEALDGVFVLATTSRPDLIDPAFLRPGRFDKCLYCGMPTVDEREDILKRLAQKARLSDEVDLRDLAHRTYRFSGADCKALIFNAQLAAVHDNLNKTVSSRKRRRDEPTRFISKTICISKIGEHVVSNELTDDEIANLEKKMFNSEISFADEFNSVEAEGSSSEKGVVVLPRHFEKALAETKPSVTEKELNRLQNVYTKFTTSSKSHLPDVGLSFRDIGQRATLA